MNIFKRAWEWLVDLFGAGDRDTGAEVVIKLVAMEVLKGKAGLALKVSEIIYTILNLVKSSKITDFSGIQAIVDAELIKITLAPEERLALGVLLNRVKAQYAKDLVAATPGKDFNTAVQYLTWIGDTARIYSA